MKKILLSIILLAFFASSAWGAGSCVLTSTDMAKPDRKDFVLTCTGDGTIAAYTLTPAEWGLKGWFLYSVTTDPGTSAPTAAYDITLVVNGEDVAGGLLADRSATATETVVICPTTKSWHIAGDAMAVTFADETANPSTVVVRLRYINN
jgi:hypothetical protein